MFFNKHKIWDYKALLHFQFSINEAHKPTSVSLFGQNLLIKLFSLQNDVFVGESLSSRVSYLEVKFDDEGFFKTRNSGLCISTGTGSTSWTFNINKLTHQSVQSLIKIIGDLTDFPIDQSKLDYWLNGRNLLAQTVEHFSE